MDAKHTPGPWFVTHYGSRDNQIPFVVAGRIGSEDKDTRRIDFTGPQVAKLLFTEQRTGGFSSYPEEAEANARLIAAAPDLLEALRGMLEAFPPPPIRSKNGMAKNLAHAAARTAISKAEGE